MLALEVNGIGEFGSFRSTESHDNVQLLIETMTFSCAAPAMSSACIVVTDRQLQVAEAAVQCTIWYVADNRRAMAGWCECTIRA